MINISLVFSEVKYGAQIWPWISFSQSHSRMPNLSSEKWALKSSLKMDVFVFATALLCSLRICFKQIRKLNSHQTNSHQVKNLTTTWIDNYYYIKYQNYKTALTPATFKSFTRDTEIPEWRDSLSLYISLQLKMMSG